MVPRESAHIGTRSLRIPACSFVQLGVTLRFRSALRFRAALAGNPSVASFKGRWIDRPRLFLRFNTTSWVARFFWRVKLLVFLVAFKEAKRNTIAPCCGGPQKRGAQLIGRKQHIYKHEHPAPHCHAQNPIRQRSRWGILLPYFHAHVKC